MGDERAETYLRLLAEVELRRAGDQLCGLDAAAGTAVWSNLKRSLANLTKRGIDQLVVLVKARLKPMQYRPGLVDGSLAKTGLDLTLP